MTFRWPEENYHRCSATMITDQIALTSAHCVSETEDGTYPGLTVRMENGEQYAIREFRVNECWDFDNPNVGSRDMF